MFPAYKAHSASFMYLQLQQKIEADYKRAPSAVRQPKHAI